MSIALDQIKQNLGKRLTYLRTEKKLGVRELALLAEIEHHQLINIEKGRVDIRMSTLIKIAKGLGVEPKELLDF